MKISELARLVGGIVEGNGDIEIKGLAGIESASPGELTFATDEENLSHAERSKASCILTNKTVKASKKPLIRVENPKLSFLIIYNTLNTPKVREAFRHPTAVVAESARLGKNVWIGPHVVIGDGVEIGDNVIIEPNSVVMKNCRIGSTCRIYPNVTLYANTVLGRNVILHSGVVIGADGFGYVRDKDKIYKFPQTGKAIVGDDVEIGANTTIDRGSMNDTMIGSGVKIDNLCQIAHNVKIGKNTIVAGHSGISGSTVIGDNSTIAGKVGIADNLTIGSNVIVGGGSSVIGDIRDGEVVWGFPARPIREMKRQLAVLSWMAKHFKVISRLLKPE
ncbi:MAG: UDP-3-O-(3-hydroxymyristoyl)glucosamine N-acyltransferase [Candidatus Omnitrophica bacterium]|nr:UDP-3-O-(3-hydroxymyristoyl)glucosamine N-acyltransferase [Candidatus Omnitrophota bacterium]